MLEARVSQAVTLGDRQAFYRVTMNVSEYDRSPSWRRASAWILLTSGLVLAVVWWNARHTSWLSADGRAIALVVGRDMTVNETVLAPPQAHRNVPITQAEMRLLAARVSERLATIYTGAALSQWRGIAGRVLGTRDMHGGKTSAWLTQWRVDWVDLHDLSVDGRSATATGSMQVHSNGGVVDRIDSTVHLRRTTHGWRVTRDTSTFEPGYGP
jgi:hypothetical protein